MADEAIDRAAAALARETTFRGLLDTACRELVELLDGSACAISRVVGDLLVGLAEFSHTQNPLANAHEYLISDYPLTRQVVEGGEPATVSRLDADADVHEAALLEKLGFDALLMVCLPSAGRCWGLVEIYGDGAAFDEGQTELAQRIALLAGERLAELERT